MAALFFMGYKISAAVAESKTATDLTNLSVALNQTATDLTDSSVAIT